MIEPDIFQIRTDLVYPCVFEVGQVRRLFARCRIPGVVERGDDAGAVFPPFRGHPVPHVQHAAGVDVVERRGEQDRDSAFLHGVMIIRTAVGSLPVRIGRVGMAEFLFDLRDIFVEDRFRDPAQRQGAESFFAVVPFDRQVFLVHPHHPLPVQPGFEESVAVEDIVAFRILDRQQGRLDIRRIGVQPGVVDRGEVTGAMKEQFPVVKRLFSDPVEQEKSVLALVEVGDADPFAFPGPAAVLVEDRVTVRVFGPHRFQVGIGVAVGVAHDDQREFSFWFRQLEYGVKPDAVRLFEHQFPDGIGFHDESCPPFVFWFFTIS